MRRLIAAAAIGAVVLAACGRAQPAHHAAPPKAAGIHYPSGGASSTAPTPSTTAAPSTTTTQATTTTTTAPGVSLPNGSPDAVSLPQEAQVAIAWARTYYGFSSTDPPGTRSNALQQLSTPDCYQQVVLTMPDRSLWSRYDTTRIATVYNDDVQIQGDIVYLMVDTETYTHGDVADAAHNEYVMKLTMAPTNAPIGWLVSVYQPIGPSN